MVLGLPMEQEFEQMASFIFMASRQFRKDTGRPLS